MPTVDPSSNVPLTNKDKDPSNNISKVDDDLDTDPMAIITKFLESDCNNVIYKDLLFVAKDMNKVLIELLPLFDDEMVDIIIIFLSVFNKKFEEDPAFREQFELAITNVVETAITAGTNAFGSSCSFIIKILTTMSQAVPGLGAVVSSLMIANNITDTGKNISNSGKEVSAATQSFAKKITDITNSINNAIPTIPHPVQI